MFQCVLWITAKYVAMATNVNCAKQDLYQTRMGSVRKLVRHSISFQGTNNSCSNVGDNDIESGRWSHCFLLAQSTKVIQEAHIAGPLCNAARLHSFMYHSQDLGMKLFCYSLVVKKINNWVAIKINADALLFIMHCYSDNCNGTISYEPYCIQSWTQIATDSQLATKW